MDSRHDNISARGSHIAKKRHNPTELKASKRTNGEENVTVLPEPTLRQVPVNVARRTSPQVVPLPPPSNTKDSDAKPKRQIPNRKQRRRIDGGSGSDSDSDRDKLNRTSDRDGVLAFPKKIPPENQGDDGQWNAALLEEETERLRQYRMSKKKNEAFAEISQHRHHTMQTTLSIIDSLLRFRRLEYGRPPLNRLVICQQEKLQDYLEENATGNNNGGPSTLPEDGTTITMDRIIDDVEAAVVKLYSAQFGKPQSSDKHRYSQVREVIAGLEKHLFSSHLYGIARSSCLTVRFLNMSPSEYEGYAKDIFKKVTLRHSWARDHYSFIDTMIDLMAEQYWDKIIAAICDVAMSVRTQRAFDPNLVNKDWKKVIEKSRQDGRLKPTYIDWVTDGIDTSMLEDVQDKYNRRRGASDQFRDTTDSQEFCPNLMAPRTVSLALAKGHIVTRTKKVSEDDLANFGWYRESLSHPLWRCQPVGDGRDIVKVDVDGKFLGLFALKDGGSDWHDWVCIEHREEFPLVRPISESEADVLGLRGEGRPKLPKGWLSTWP